MPAIPKSQSIKRLARRLLDVSGSQWRQLPNRARLVPGGGWIAAIRDAIGMSQTELGKRMDVRASTVAKLESSERSRKIQLSTLHRAAEALNCDLVYSLVPRKPLQSMVDDQRLRLFAETVSRTDLHMGLEGQATSKPDWQHHLLRQAEDVIPDSQLWRAALAVTAKKVK